eukprot:Rhum_TRINITY_DN17307_c0_g2::Rhum_TRINITY_DN17307_c0_g2_i1::g.165727::m.165727
MRPAGLTALAVLFAVTLRCQPVEGRKPTLAGFHGDPATRYKKIVKTNNGFLALAGKSTVYFTVVAAPQPSQAADTIKKQGSYTEPVELVDCTYDTETDIAYTLSADNKITPISYASNLAPLEGTAVIPPTTCSRVRFSKIGSRKIIFALCGTALVVFEVPAVGLLSKLGLFELSKYTTFIACSRIEAGHYNAETAALWIVCGSDILYIAVPESALNAGSFSPKTIQSKGSAVYDIFVAGDKAAIGLSPSLNNNNYVEIWTGGDQTASLDITGEGSLSSHTATALALDTTRATDIYVMTATPACPLAFKLNPGTDATFYEPPGTQLLNAAPTPGAITYGDILIVTQETSISLYILNTLCSAFTCSYGFQDKAGKASIACVGNPAVCN